MLFKTIKHFLLLLIVCITTFSYAQEKATISGIIKDADTGETVLGANIYFKNTSMGTMTNNYGFYSMTVPKGNYNLIVSYLGYNTIEKNISLVENNTLNIELIPSETALEEIVIVSEESERTNIKKPQASVSKLKAETIKKIPVVFGEVDVIKSIQMLPGVTNNGEASSGFNVRGGAADQNLVLLDEAIIYNTSHLLGFFSVFNVDAIKDMKLYRGGIPAQFGGRVASVLDVQQKDGNQKQFSLSGGIGLVSSRLLAEGPLFNKKGSFMVAGRTSYIHFFLPLFDIKSKAYFYDVNAKGHYKINKNNKLYLSSYFGRDVFDLDKIFKNSYGNNSINLRWNHIFNPKLFSNLSLIYSKYDYKFTLKFLKFDWFSDIENFNLKYDFQYFENETFKWKFGVSGITYDFNPGEIAPSGEESFINAEKLDKKRAFESGVYVDLEHKISNKLRLQYGLRYSQFDRLGGQPLNNYANNQPVVYNSTLDIYERGTAIGETQYTKNETIASFGNFEPRFALSYQLNNTTSLKTSVHRIAQYIHLLSNTSSTTPLDVWTPSGKFIKPQLSNQYTLGYFKNFAQSKYSLEVETYYKTVDNRIDYIDGSELIGQNTIETEILNGKSEAYGLEVLFKKNKGDFTGWIAYTLSKSRQQTLGGNAGGNGINNGEWYSTPYDRPHDISIFGSYKLNDKWSFGTNAIYQTGRPVTYPNGQYEYEGIAIANYSLRNQDRLPSYHRIDVSAIYTPKQKRKKRWKGEWVFSIYNLYNRRNAASISFMQNSATGLNEAERTAIFGMVPSVSYNFKF
ncbi:MAG: TonB-dependent receptor [Polaribacter sp.]